MKRLDRRHLGRQIRRNRRKHPGTGLMFVDVAPVTEGFARALERAVTATAMPAAELTQIWARLTGIDLNRLDHRLKIRQPLIHNGRKHR